MKKVKLIRVYTGGGYEYYDYDEDTISRLIPESEMLEITDEEYTLLTDYRVRNKIMQDRYGQYYDKLILIEDQTKKIPELIKSAKEVLDKIKEKEEADKKKAAAAAAARKAKIDKAKIEKARKLLKEAGELK